MRRPDQTVASFAVRRWFVDPVVRGDPRLPPSYREGTEPRHFFGRNLPHGAEFERWSALSQIGKLAWFWAARNRAILDQLAELPASSRRVERLEDLDFPRYRGVAAFLGWDPEIREARFDEVARARINRGLPPRGPGAWSPTEIVEFEAEVGELAQALGYEHRVHRLLAPDAAAVRSEPPTVAAIVDRLAVRSGPGARADP